MNLAVALLTCDRLRLTKRTLESLAKHNDLSQFTLCYADDASTDARVRPLAESFGFEPVVLNETRRGCSPTTDRLVHAARERVGGDGVIVYLQNDFRSVRPLHLAVFEEALSRKDVGAVWFARRVARPKNRELRRVQWKPTEIAGEAAFIAQSGWSYTPHACRASLMTRLVKDVHGDLQYYRRAARTGLNAILMKHGATVHIGRGRHTKNGIFKQYQEPKVPS